VNEKKNGADDDYSLTIISFNYMR